MTSAEIIDEVTSRLKRAVPAESRVVLFGSQARGDTHQDSDFDVLVIEPSVENSAAESSRLKAELDGLNAAFDIVVVDAKRARWESWVAGTLIERALREGRELVGS